MDQLQPVDWKIGMSAKLIRDLQIGTGLERTLCKSKLIS
jgi:hypothetical protein